MAVSSGSMSRSTYWLLPAHTIWCSVSALMHISSGMVGLFCTLHTWYQLSTHEQHPLQTSLMVHAFVITAYWIVPASLNIKQWAEVCIIAAARSVLLIRPDLWVNYHFRVRKINQQPHVNVKSGAQPVCQHTQSCNCQIWSLSNH